MIRSAEAVGEDDRKLLGIVMLVEDGFDILDLAGPLQVFSTVDTNGSIYRTVAASLRGGNVGSAAGVAVKTEMLASIRARGIDTLLAIGGAPDGPSAAGVEGWLAANAGAIRRLCGIGRGIGRLAGAALVPRRAELLHWKSVPVAAAIARGAPIARLHGAFWTCAGGSAAIDLALELVSQDRGEAAALAAAETLLLPLRRRLDDPQISEVLAMQVRGGAPFAGLLHRMRGDLAADMRVETLAAWCNMSPRTFARRFAAATGTTPAAAVEALRLEAAATLLRSGRLPLKQVAASCGFGSELRLRRAFQRSGKPE